MASSVLRFLDHTQRRTTVGRTPLNERSARRRSCYINNKQKIRTSMPSVGLEPAIPVIKRHQIFALDRRAGGIGQKASRQTTNYANRPNLKRLHVFKYFTLCDEDMMDSVMTNFCAPPAHSLIALYLHFFRHHCLNSHIKNTQILQILFQRLIN